MGGGVCFKKKKLFFLVGERDENVPLGLGNYIRVMVALLTSKLVLWWQHRQHLVEFRLWTGKEVFTVCLLSNSSSASRLQNEMRNSGFART